MAKKETAVNKMPSMDDHWPDSDARTLADAHEIMADPKRHAAAQKAAKGMAEKKTDEAVAMHHVAHHKPPMEVDDSVRVMPFKKK